MPDETRRAIVTAGMAGAVAAFTSWPDRVSGAGQGQGGGRVTTTRTVELPGLFDLQVNGFAGVDFGDPALAPEKVLHAAEAIGKTGVTRFLPTLITSSLDSFSSCARALVRATHPAIAGLHMEGPYISPEDGYRGAHDRAFVRAADRDDFRRRQDAAEGRIRLVTLGNGCPAMLPRHPNVIWEQLGDDRLMASFIVDGHHLPPATVRSMIRAKTPGRSILVTDAIAAAGMPPGRYTLGGQEVELSPEGRVAVPGAPNLAGSALRLDVAIANAVRFTGLPLEEIVEMASRRPAEYLGIPTAGKVVAEWDPVAFTLRVVRVSG
jgi:N-acetylglucosamine-6-phosphate deacetylase